MLRTSITATALLCALLLAVCLSLPEHHPREKNWKLNAGDSALARTFDADSVMRSELPGAQPMSEGIEALAARVALARSAETTLDVQYCIWHADRSGSLRVKELLSAADLGVRVRLLLDDIGVGQADENAFCCSTATPMSPLRCSTRSPHEMAGLWV